MFKKKVVFWKKAASDTVKDNFSTSPEYHAFFHKCNEHFDFRIAIGSESYKGNGVFDNVRAYENWKIIPTQEKFQAEVIYQFSNAAANYFDNAIPMVNSTEFKNWCSDKWNQYELLEEFMPKSFLVESTTDLENHIKEIKTSRAVLKPRKGQKGENIITFDTATLPQLDSDILMRKNYILQEYSDTNVQMPGIISGVHDIKLITIGDSIFANLRTPEKDKDYCTFDSPYSELNINQLPQEVLELHKKAKKKIDSRFPGQLYTIDVGITKDGPVIFELNGHTAFPYLHFDYTETFLNALIQHIDSI